MKSKKPSQLQNMVSFGNSHCLNTLLRCSQSGVECSPIQHGRYPEKAATRRQGRRNSIDRQRLRLEPCGSRSKNTKQANQPPEAKGRGRTDSHVDFTDLHGGGPAHTMILNSRTEVVNIQYIIAPFVCVLLPATL